MRSLSRALDHVLLGVPDLNRGVEWFADLTGVLPKRGGRHAGLGTWNAIVPLGARQYIELIAPDPEQAHVPTFYVPDLREYGEPRIARWAASIASVDTADALRERSLSKGFHCDAPRESSRTTAEGRLLSWKVVFPIAPRLPAAVATSVIPFFIEWSGSSHPGDIETPACRIGGMSIAGPDHDPISQALRGLGITADVARVDTTTMTVTLLTPRGETCFKGEPSRGCWTVP